MRYYTLVNTQQPKYKPVAEERNWPARPSVYPSGEAIPESLPNSYQLHQDCNSCAAYNPKTTICSTYKALVLSNYWCNTWKAR